MRQEIEITKEYLRNIDHADKDISLSFLEAAPPCRTYYDFGDQLKRYVYGALEREIRRGASEKDAIVGSADLPALEARKERLRERMLTAIGGLPSCADDLHARVTGTVKADGYRMEKIIFTARPGVYVTGNLYVPDGLQEKTAAVLFVCGHAQLAKAHPAYQRVCHLLAMAGMVALIIDPVGQGERFSYLDESGAMQVEWGCPEHDHVGAQTIMAGYSSARYFVHDAMRAVDYLCSRPEVDNSRIGVTGSSGGGTQTALMMMLDGRIAAAAPGTFISSLEAIMRSGIVQDAEQIWNGLAEEGFDHDDILLMMAPRPVMLLGVAYDFFPIEGVRHTYESARRFYRLYGKEQNLSVVIDTSEHQYSLPLAKNAVDFFSRVFLGRPFSPEMPIPTFSPEQCRCTRSGQIKLDFPGARFIFDENRDVALRMLAEREALPDDAKQERAIAWLRERVCGDYLSVERNVRRVSTLLVEGMSAQTLFYWSSDGLLSNMLLFTDANARRSDSMPITLAVWEGGTANLVANKEFLREKCSAGEAVAILDLSGFGALAPNRINTMPMYGFEGTLCGFSQHMLWRGDSLTALRIHEICTALSLLEEEMSLPPDGISVYANGYPAFPAAAAVLLHKGRVRDAAFENAPPEIMGQVMDRLYESRDVMNRVFPGTLPFFSMADLMRWAQAAPV